jgi:hypothetical protein
MISPDEGVPLSITAADLNIVFAALAKLPYEAVAQVIDRLRQQVLLHDPQAFDAPRVNGVPTSPPN